MLASLDALPPLPPPLTLMVEVIAPTPPASPPKPQPTPVERRPAVKPVARPAMPTPPPLAIPAAAASAVAAVSPVAKETTPPAAAPAPASVQSPRFDADYLNNPAPAYPPMARRLGEEGKVVLRVFVEPSGRPGQIEVKTGSGSPRLDQAAQDAVWRWKFVAARRGDETLGAWVLVPIVFNLKG
ncbi:MAG: energy transducer TonB [Bacteroidota bacterium]